MLTPAFELSQNKEFLIISIKAPYAKISETEIFIEDSDFKFFSKPYFLRLALPGNIVEDGRETADYDTDKGSFTITVPKETAGEHFEGLDMLTKLLAPKGTTAAAPPLIQVIDQDVADEPSESSENPDVPDDADNDADDDGVDNAEREDYEWRVEQTPYLEAAILVGAPKYGFANQKSGVFQRLQEELCRVVDCPDPDTLTVPERRAQRLEEEHAKFDADHYLADLYEDDVIQTLIAYKPPWCDELEMIHRGVLRENAVELTEDEKYAMRKLPRKEYLLSQSEETSTYLGLIDIIFAYCYNHRTSEGDNNVESGWTISKLSATLSWLEVYSSVQEVLEGCFRRSLCYPLYRHWSLSLAVLQDVIHSFRIGRRRLLKCLLEVYSLLLDEDTRYVLNDLYITDYAVWIQSASVSKIESLADALSKVTLSKKDVNFDLEELEKLSKAAMNESDDSVTEVTDQLAGISVHPSQQTGSESEYSTGSDDSDDSLTSDSEDSADSNDDDSETEQNILCAVSQGDVSSDRAVRTSKKPLIVEIGGDCESGLEDPTKENIKITESIDRASEKHV